MFAYCLGLGDFRAGCCPGSPALAGPARAVHEELGGPAFTQVSFGDACSCSHQDFLGWVAWLAAWCADVLELGVLQQEHIVVVKVQSERLKLRDQEQQKGCLSLQESER